jgi:CheY-like chemotaxis protein
VLEAADGLKALALLHTARVPLIMPSNHHLPRLDGPGLFARILVDPLLPIWYIYLYMTGDRALAPAVLRRLRALHVPAVWKPFDAAELLAVIADAAGRLPSAPPSPRLAAGSRT